MPTTITAMPDGPTSEPTTVPADGGWAENAWAWITGIPNGLWYALAAAIITIGLISSIRIATGKKRSIRSLKGDKFLTFLAAGVSTSVVATGMWKFFGDVLNVSNPIARGALFAVFEIAMLASAFRSRRFRLDRAAKREADPEPKPGEKQRIDVDGIAVWALALVSGAFAAADETTNTAKAVRVVVPLLAAWMWERGLAGELMQFSRSGKRINLRLTPERVLVWLGIAEPTDRGIGEVARRRRIARFARTAFRLHRLLEKPGTSRIREARIGWLRWRLRRQTESGNEHLNLAADQAALHDVRLQIALLYGAEDGTSRAAVQELTPLKPVVRVAISDRPFEDERPSQERTQALLTEVRTDPPTTFAPSKPPPSQEPTHSESAVEYPAASPAENAPAKVTEKPVAKPPASVPAKADKTLRTPIESIAEDGPDSVRKLASAFARKPGGTNAELAKLAKVSIGSANRHLPRIRAAANAGDTADDSQERAQAPLITTRIENPKKPVLTGTNGSTFPTQETQS